MGRRTRWLPAPSEFRVSTCLFLLPVLCRGASEPWWPMKSGDLNRTGRAVHAAPFDISKPSWIWQEPGLHEKKGWPMQVFHSSPIIDGESNIYLPSTTGWVYSIDKTGLLRWETELSGKNPCNLALLDGALYTASDDGMAWALDSATGKVRWKVRIGLASAADTSSTLAVGDTVLLPATPDNWRPEAHKADAMTPECGTEELVALSTIDGSEKWRYSMVNRSGNIMYNVMPALVGDAIVFADMSGALYKLSLKDGKELWYEPAVNPGTWSTGGMVVGPNNRVYVAANAVNTMACNGQGILRAHDLATGEPLWNRSFDFALNVAPAVGALRSGGPLAVVLGVGDNLAPFPLPWWLKPIELFFVARNRPQAPTVALDAETGDLIWTFERPMYSYVNAGVSFDEICAPDVYGVPLIGADGTVYINWSGGKFYALKDANGDGQIDSEDPAELQALHHGEGSNGESAIAPGLLVAVTCKKVFGYVF